MSDLAAPGKPSPSTPAAPQLTPAQQEFQKGLAQYYTKGGNLNANQLATFGGGVGGGGEGSSQAWSKYDQGLNVTKEGNYGFATQEKRAREQPLGEKLLNGVTKAGANAVAAGLGAVAAPIDWGIATFSSKYDMSNAPVGSALAKWNEDVGAANPHYYSQKEQDADAFSATNLLSTNFFSDKFLSGVGFLAGAAAGAWVTGGIGEFAAARTAMGTARGLAAAADLLGGESAMARGLAKLAVSTENHVAGLEQIAQAVRTGDRAAAQAALKNAVGSIKIQTRAQQAFNMAASTHGEAIMESMGSYNEVKQSLTDKKLTEKQNHREQLTKELLAMNPTLNAEQLEAGLEQAGLGMEAVQRLTGDEENDIEQVSASTRQAVYLGNVAVLSLSNAIQLKSILSRGYGDLLREADTGLFKAVLGADGKYALNAPKWLQRAGYAAAKAAPSEMAEEGSQTLMQKTALAAGSDLLGDIEHRRSDLGHQINPQAAQLIRDEVLGAYGTFRAFRDNALPTLGAQLHDKEFQESVLLGGLIGVLGDGGHKAFAKVTGNSESARQKAQAQVAVDFLNTYGRKGSFAEQGRQLVRALSNEMDVERSVQNKNGALHDESRNNQLRDMVVSAKKAGRMDELRDSLDTWAKLAQQEDTDGVPDGETPLSTEGLKQMRQTVDELDALYDQTSIAYGRAFKGGKANVDAAFENIAAAHLRGKSLDELAQRVAASTQTTAGNDGFDLKGFFAGKDPRAAVTYSDINTAANEFARSRGQLVGDPSIVNLKADLAQAAQLRKATALNNADLLAIQEGTLGNRLSVLQAQAQASPALLPQYRQILRERAEAAPTPADQGTEGSNPDAEETPDLAVERAAALATVNLNKSTNNPAPGQLWRSAASAVAPAFAGATREEVQAQIAAHFDQLDAEQATAVAQAVRDQAAAGTPSGTDAGDVAGDTTRVGDIADTGQDADAYYATIASATAQTFGANVSTADTASGVAGLPVLSSPVTVTLPLGPGEGQLTPRLIHLLNEGDVALILTPQPAVVDEASGEVSYELALQYRDGTIGQRFTVTREALQQTPGVDDLLAAHQLIQDGQLPELASGIPVRTHALVDIGTNDQNNQQVQGNMLPYGQRELLFDPKHAVVVRVTAGQATSIWGTQNSELEVAANAVAASQPNGDYLIHGTLRQDGAPAIFPLDYGQASTRIANEVATNMDAQPASTVIPYVTTALRDNAGIEATWDGNSLVLGEQQFSFDENAWNQGERDLNTLFTAREEAPAEGSPTAGTTGVQDNAALAELAAQVGAPIDTSTAPAPAVFLETVNDMIRELPVQTPEEQAQRIQSAQVAWNPQNSTGGVRVLGVTAAVRAQLPAPPNEADERDADPNNPGTRPEGGATLDELRQLVSSVLPAGVTVDEVEAQHSRFAKDGKPAALIIGYAMKLISGRMDSRSKAWHESFHIAMRYVFTSEERNRLLAYAYKEANIDTSQAALDKARATLPFLATASDQYVEDYLLEEWLADKFAEFQEQEEKGKQQVGWLANLWRKLVARLRASLTPEVQNLFAALSRGDLRSRELAPLFGENGQEDFRDIALSYIPQAGSVRAQESQTQVLLAYFVNAKHNRLAVRESVRPGQRPLTFNLPSVAQLTEDYVANTGIDLQGKPLTDAQLFETILHRRRQEDTVAIPAGLEGDALTAWLEANHYYLPSRADEWRLSGRPAPLGRAYRKLYTDATARQSLQGEILKREQGLRVMRAVEDATSEDAQAVEQSERNYDAGPLEGGDHLPARLMLYLSTIIYREEQEPGGPLVIRSVDPRTIMRRLRTIANVAVLPKSAGAGTTYPIGSLADFVQKVRDVASQGQGTQEGAMLSALAARMAADFGFPNHVDDAEKRGEHQHLANLRLIFNESNQRRMPALLEMSKPDGSTKMVSAQRRPLWTEVMSTARQIWGVLSTRDRRDAAAAAKQAVSNLRAKVAAWTAEYDQSVSNGNQKNAKLVSRTVLLRELKKLSNAYKNLGLVLPEEFYLAAMTGNDTAYEVKVRATRTAGPRALPGIVTTETRDDAGNLVATKSPQKSLFKEPLETSRASRNDLLDELEKLAEAIEADPEADIFTGAFLPLDDNDDEVQKTQRRVRLSTRNIAQQASDYDAVAMENMWLDAQGRKQRSYMPGSYLVEAAWGLENGILPTAAAPMPFLREEYDAQYSGAKRETVRAQQDGVLNKLGSMGKWLRKNWLVKNHLNGVASLGSLRYFYDAGKRLELESGQVGQNTTDLSESDTLLSHLSRFQHGIISVSLLEAAKLSLLVQHSDHTGDSAWVEHDAKDGTEGRLKLSYLGMDMVQQQVAALVTHMKLVLDELYGDEASNVKAIDPADRVDNVHGKLPLDGTPIRLPLKRLDAEGNPTLARKDAAGQPIEVERDEDGNEVELTRSELEQLLLNTNDYTALPRGLQPLDLPLLQGAQIQDPSGETEDRVPLTLGTLLMGQGFAGVNEEYVAVEGEMLREVVEADLNQQYKDLRRRMATEGLNESHVAPLRGLSGKELNKPTFSIRTTKERNVTGNRTDYASTEQFLGDFLFKSQLFRDAYGHLTRGHEANFPNSTTITKRGKGMSGFGPHAGEGEFSFFVLPTIEEGLDSRTMLPATEDTSAEFVITADATDGQGYITRDRLKEYMAKWWNLSEQELAVMDKALLGEPMTTAENEWLYEKLHEVSAGPIKSMLYGLVSREGGMTNPLYAKMSVLPLIPAFTSQRVELPGGGVRFVARPGMEWYHDLRERMENFGMQEAYHTTAVKVGGNQLSSADHKEPPRTRYAKNNNMRRQQVIPAGKQEIISGSQLLALIDGNMSDSAEVLVGGVTTTVSQLRAAYTRLHTDARDWQLKRARGLATTTLDGENLLWKLVRDQQRQMGLSEGELQYMAQENGKFIFNPNLPVVEATLLSSMLNFLGKQSLRYKTPGGKYTLASSAGFKIYDQLDEAGNVVGVQNPFEARPLEEFDEKGHWQPGKLTHPNGAPRFSAEGRSLKLHNPKMSEADKLVTMGEARGYSFLLGLSSLITQNGSAEAQLLADQGTLQSVLRELDINPAQVSAAGLGQALATAEKLETITKTQWAMLSGVLSKLPAEPVNVGRQVESIDYAECIISGDFLLQYGLQPEDLMNPSKITPEAREALMKMLGYRIPTQAHQSMIPLKVVGIAPGVMGSTIFAPNGITYVAGSDFDIDALFTKRQALWKDQTGQHRAYGEAATPQEQDAEYRQAVKGDKFYKAILPKALLEVRANVKGVWEHLKKLGVLPEQVVTQLEAAVKVGGLENLRLLRDDARAMRLDIENTYGSFARLNELAGLERLAKDGKKNKVKALNERFAQKLYPDLALADAVAQYDENRFALQDALVKNGHSATFLIEALQQRAELLRTALEVQTAKEDEEASDDQADTKKPGTLEKVLAHYLTLSSLKLPLTAWQAVQEGVQTQQAISNQLLKTELALLTAPALWPQLSMGTDTGHLLSRAKEMQEFFDMGSVDGQAYNSEAVFLNQRTATYAGRENIGFSAYMNAAVAWAAKLGLRIREGGLKMGDRTLTTFAVQREQDLDYEAEREGGKIVRYKLKESKSRFKTQSMTDHVSNDTDNAKNQGSVYLNYNKTTNAIIMMLLSQGYGEERTNLFMMQPVIRAQASYEARQTNSLARSAEDPRDFGQRLGDLERLVQELVLTTTGKGTKAGDDPRYRRKAALEAVDYLAPFGGRNANGPAVPTFKNGKTVEDFSDRIIIESLNRRKLGAAVMGALLSTRLPDLTGSSSGVATEGIANLLDSYGISTEADIKAFYAYLIQQQAFSDRFEKLGDVVKDLYTMATVTSLVKGDISSEQDLQNAKRKIESVDSMTNPGLKTLVQADGAEFSFFSNPLTAQLVKTLNFVFETAEATFARFGTELSSVLSPIMETLDVAGDKPALREMLTAELLNITAAQAAARSGWLSEAAVQRGYDLMTHYTDNIVVRRAETLAAHPELANNPLMRKMEEVLPGKNGAVYYGLKANLVGIDSQELDQLRDALTSMALHADPMVREFAEDLKAYVRVADGPTASSQSLARVLSAEDNAAFSGALDFATDNNAANSEDNLKNWFWGAMNDVRERLFARPDVRVQVPVRQQTLGALNTLAEMGRRAVEGGRFEPSSVQGMAQAQLAIADKLAADRNTNVTVASGALLRLGLQELAPGMEEVLTEAGELLRPATYAEYWQKNPDKREQRRRLEEEIQTMVNDALQLTGERDRMGRVSLLGKKDKSFAPVMGMEVYFLDGELQLNWRLPAAIRLSAPQDAAAQNDATDAQQVNEGTETSETTLSSMRFGIARTTALAVAHGEEGARFFIENNLAIGSQVPQQPGRPFGEWAGELMSRERDLSALGQELGKGMLPFIERIGDAEAGARTVANNEALLKLLMQERTPEQQSKMEIAASVLSRVYGNDLNHLTVAGQVQAVSDQLDDTAGIACEA